MAVLMQLSAVPVGSALVADEMIVVNIDAYASTVEVPHRAHVIDKTTSDK